ncbi:MAG: RecX family transcriptional regulator [Chlorobi bacterium]|nr:RecX family transcriptional regulator [Chlorobiota bacterium]
MEPELKMEQLLRKAIRWCIRTERTPAEAKAWLKRKYHLDDSEASKIVSLLEQWGIIDLNRFMEYAYYELWEQKRYGRLKIRGLLESHMLPEPFIEVIIAMIDDEEYAQFLRNKILELYESGLSAQKVLSRLLSRGFEKDLIVEIMREHGLIPDEE